MTRAANDSEVNAMETMLSDYPETKLPSTHSWRVVDKNVARRRIERLATLMDDAFTVPGINKKIGYDGLVGLIPGVGDLATCLVSGYIIVEAARAGVPKRTVAGMVGRLGIDTVVGAVPLLGDFFDFAYKANRRNAKAALRHLN